ncbi:hypothetical protein BCR35DRAFT_335797 [Leucosporidium creatinivorum]|uniref:ATPase inhibitor, mitochondrial n=1 Tax=Leucosporidium creatinivorum TaxID=106004 RepID=A0A1Y2D4Y3_9BASI|nr:hypothetical protein BCR35DRAFT_335797 [Leucosporidium creatinivorum]
MLSLRTITATRTATRTFSTSLLLRAGGSPSGTSNQAFNKREKAAEEQFVRDQEREKLKALRKSIEASKEHLQQLEKDHQALEASVESKTVKQ